MVAVDLEIVDDRLAGVRVRGEFAVSPAAEAESTLAAIAAALNGAPADLDGPALAARVRAAIPFGVELVGTSPEAIAAAVRQAVGGNEKVSGPRERAGSSPQEEPARSRGPLASQNRIGTFTPAEVDALTAGWRDLTWRLIPERPLSPAVNVALDEVLSEQVVGWSGASVVENHSPTHPFLRFWRWTEPAVVIGRCQSVSNEVDRAAAAEAGVRVVRRMTGGGAMFVQPHGTITYSLGLPEAAVAGLTIRQSYEVCDSWVIRGLRDLGIDAHHVPVNDIACADGKIGGAAQSRRRGVVLHHTTIAYDMDPGEMARVLRIGREKLSERAVASARKRVSPLARQTGLSREEIVGHLLAAFRRRFGGAVGELTAAELAAAEKLVGEKYGRPEWTEEFA